MADTMRIGGAKELMPSGGRKNNWGGGGRQHGGRRSWGERVKSCPEGALPKPSLPAMSHAHYRHVHSEACCYIAYGEWYHHEQQEKRERRSFRGEEKDAQARHNGQTQAWEREEGREKCRHASSSTCLQVCNATTHENGSHHRREPRKTETEEGGQPQRQRQTMRRQEGCPNACTNTNMNQKQVEKAIQPWMRGFSDAEKAGSMAGTGKTN